MIASRTNGKIQSITSDRDTMLRVFGATRYKQDKDPFQECLYLYPELLQDSYCRESLLSIKNKIVKEGRAGRLEINGKYLFIIPDLYAACQHWFLGIEEPDGLLRDGEIYCRVYPESEKLDCLRSPHLYREHAVRINMFRDGRERRRWFQTDGVYTSSHDLISKILQFDCDGDRSLVCADPVIINAAERNCKDIVPLYYDMKKAPAHIIDSNEMYLGMENAYKGGSIGPISNDISGIWNSPEPDLDVIKLLCALNNFVIDYAKTLYKPVPPKDVESRIRAATKGKVPHFFVYAKDKEESQVEPINRSVVNRLEYIVKASKLRFNTKSLGRFDYLMLMSEDIREFTQRDLDAIALYYKLARSANMRMANDEENDKDNYYFVFEKIRAQLLEVLPDENRLVNVLVKQLFELRKAKRKRVFWGCFGSVVLENLRANIDAKTVMCESCGRRFIPSNARHRFCPICAKEHSRMMTRERVRKYRQKQK